MATTFRVAVLDDYQLAAQRFGAWQILGDDVQAVFFADHVSDSEQLIARLTGFHAVIAMRERTRFPRSVLARLPQLQLIVTAAMRNAAIDLDAARELGIVVCGTEGWIGNSATIEMAWALILASTRGVAREDAAIRHGAWQIGIGTGLYGKTLGLVGLGGLGPLMVPIAKAFGMHVVAWSVNMTAETAISKGADFLTREDFFANADVVSIHIKLSDRSRGYITRDDLRTMKTTAHLINTSRGPVVDEAALLDALREGWIAGAGLDVYDIEPLPADHPFRTAPNLVLSPHSGYVTVGVYEEFYGQFLENIRNFRAGEPARVMN
jgi:phosphoglycerate dehydrogenase-like enzyme